MLKRAEGLGFPLREHLESGLITVRHLVPGEITPSEFACIVRDSIEPDAEGRRVSVVTIDSLNGYLNSMPHERFLTVQLHELLQFLGEHDITTIIVVAQHGMLGHAMMSPVDASYLADAVILFRYFEANGEIRQALSIVKNRTGKHERTIRELKLSERGIEIGRPLREFRGILQGTPVYRGRRCDVVGERRVAFHMSTPCIPRGLQPEGCGAAAVAAGCAHLSKNSG